MSNVLLFYLYSTRNITLGLNICLFCVFTAAVSHITAYCWYKEEPLGWLRSQLTLSPDSPLGPTTPDPPDPGDPLQNDKKRKCHLDRGHTLKLAHILVSQLLTFSPFIPGSPFTPLDPSGPGRPCSPCGTLRKDRKAIKEKDLMRGNINLGECYSLFRNR